MDVAQFIQRHRSAVIAAAAIGPLVASAVLASVRDGVTAATAVLILVLMVVSAASTGDRVAGIVAALSGGVWFDFLLTEPYGTLAINDPNDVEAAILLVVIGAAVTEVALWGHRQQARANRRTGYLDGVLGTAEIVALRQQTPEALTTHIAEQIREVLGVARCTFVPGPVRDRRIAVLDHEGLVTRHDHVVDVDRDGLPTDDHTALLVRPGEHALGHFLIVAAADIARPTLEQRRVAVLLADQAGPVLANPAR